MNYKDQIIHHNKLYISCLYFLTLTFISHPVFSQIFPSEQNPLSVKWRQIDHRGFKLIYPIELEKEAQRMANTIPYIFPMEGASLGVQQTTLPIILQNRGVIANGFVQLAPRKSEFFTTPPQYFDSQDWLNNLAVHELRHVAQYDKLTHHTAVPLVEEIYLAWMGASIPLWFFEGDAVSTETSLTNAGRGRQPSWIMPYRTLLLEGKRLSYSKANFGSQKDITPGYYQLGYLLTSEIRRNFGRNIFDSLLTDIRKRPLRPYPFAGSLKKITQKTGKQWFDSTQISLQKQWQEQDKNNTSTTYEILNKKATYATNYFLPQRLENGSILTLKQSKAETAHFVEIDSNKKEKQWFGIGYQEQPWFSYANGKLVWDEIRNDPRFGQRSYSVICVYDRSTKKVRKLQARSRLFSPALSADGTKVIAVEIDLSNQSTLVELEVATGKTLFRYPNPENLILQSPAFHPDGKRITYVSVSEKGKAIWMSGKNRVPQQLTTETNQQLNRPQFLSSGIAFNAHYSGLDNIYYIDTTTKEISALSEAKYGAFNASFSTKSKELLFNDYNAEGYQIAHSTFNPQKIQADQFVFFGEPARVQENTGNVFLKTPDSNFVSKTYGKFSHLLNFHSLTPVVENEYTGGLQFKSHNLLNTFEVLAGANYHSDLKRFEYKASVSVKSLYPILTVNYENRPVRTFYTQNKITRQGDWRENYIKLNAMIPVNLNALDDYYNFAFNIGTSLTKRYMPENLPANFITSLNFPMDYRFTFSHGKRQAERDIAPRWSQIIRLKYIHQPFDEQLAGELFSIENFFYTPGFMKNHSFLVNFNYQQASGIRRYNTEINKVYGYNNILAKTKLSNTLLFNYRFPFAFPDAEVGPLVYIRNLRATLFCHYENIGQETNFAEPKTYGFELRSSMNLLRYEPIVDLGARVVFVNKVYHQNPILELIFNYSF
ncbi:TolB family protein [Pedobacter sp.]|uniref:TolB family protein n=1 Tax=Pedobacter sp. TaxID=1411316 RepID=UPI003D7FA319